MTRKQYLLMAATFLLLIVAAFGQSKPFPQGLSYPGCIKPNHVTQVAMNTSVGAYYDYWKSMHLKNNLTTLPGGYYVKGNITGSADGFQPLGSSEGQGYGMVITALMAGYDPNAKTIYDGLFKTARAFRSSANSNLMGWVVADATAAQGHFDSATDGDMDIAYSLILAHYQWGSAGTINYLEEAKKMITNGLKASNVTSNNRLNLGDWDSKSTYNTRPSDWMLSHMRAFYAVTGDVTWLNVINNLYSVYNGFTNTYSPSTGLVTDFIVGNPAAPCPANFLDEYPETNTWSYNACRFPLRIVMDYALYGGASGKTAADKMATWIKGKSGGNPANIRDGYKLDGTATGSYATAVFVSPFIAASVTNSAHQAFVNSGWDWMKNKKEDYYSDSYNMLCMLFISGNWWIPQAGPTNNAPVVSISSPVTGSSFTEGNTVTINANATDSDGSVSKVEFFVDGAKIGEDLSLPYSFNYTAVTGTHSLTAKATDDKSATATSATVSITVTALPNNAPTVSITAPATGTSVTEGTSISITADAADSDGSIAKVEFFVDGVKIGEDLSLPYSFNYTAVTGTHSLTAKATDDKAKATTSSAVSITVTAIPNDAPTVSISSPANGASFNTGTVISIAATAADTDGSVAKVEFFVDGTKIGEDLSLPYSFNYTAAAGTHSLTAKAIDDKGKSTTSSAVSITVTTVSTQTPYGGTVRNIPGTIEAEHYDLGGQGVAFNDLTTGNSGNAFRTDAVDIEATNDGGAGFNVGWIQANEWLEYTVNVLTAGTYKLDLRVAAIATGKKFRVELDGINISGSIAVPNTTGWATWQTVSVNTTSLTTGQKIMRVFAETGDFNLNYVAFTSTVPNNAPTVNITSPSGGASFEEGTTITINADAADSDGSVAKVEFFRGTTLIGTDNTIPYTVNWTGAAAGTYSLTAKATDDKGAVTTSSAVSVTVTSVPNNLPTTSITSPAGGAVFTTPVNITINADAADSDGSITKVEFFRGTTKIGEDVVSPYSVTWTGATAGTYALTTKATDNRGAVTTSEAVSITVNNPPNNAPTVNISSPAGGATFTAPANITINANAADSDGSVAKVEFFNGTTLIGTDATIPYSVTWTGAAAGTYSLTAKATDDKGASTTSATVSITVNPSTNTCSGVAQYVENGGYTDGSKVQNAGSQYACKPYPYTGWCNGASWAYAPGTGAYWTDAWTLVGSCSGARSAATTTTSGNALMKSTPNPFDHTTTITVSVETAGETSVIVYDQLGREVAVLVNGYLTADTYSFSLDGKNMQSGIYVCKFVNNDKVVSTTISKQ